MPISSSVSVLSSPSECSSASSPAAAGSVSDRHAASASAAETRPALMAWACDLRCLYRLLLVLKEKPQGAQG